MLSPSYNLHLKHVKYVFRGEKQEEKLANGAFILCKINSMECSAHKRSVRAKAKTNEHKHLPRQKGCFNFNKRKLSEDGFNLIDFFTIFYLHYFFCFSFENITCKANNHPVEFFFFKFQLVFFFSFNEFKCQGFR